MLHICSVLLLRAATTNSVNLTNHCCPVFVLVSSLVALTGLFSICFFMMDPTTMLQHLTDTIENPSIVCRVIKTWDIIYPNNSRCRNMRYLLVDTQGTAIEAEITKADENLLSTKPADGAVYLFKRFRVEVPKPGYNATGHTYIIRMNKWSEVSEIQRPTVEPPTFYFKFKEFEELGTIFQRVSSNIIGRIASIGPVEEINSSNGPAQVRDILIVNPRYRLVVQVLDDTTRAEFTLLGKQAESIITKKADLVFAEARRTNRMVPITLERICGKRFLFTVDINTSQVHKGNTTYDVNKIEPIPATLPATSRPLLLPPNIREEYFRTSSDSSGPVTQTEGTGLSPHAALLNIESSSRRCSPTSSQSTGTKRKLFTHPKEENAETSAAAMNNDLGDDDATSAATA